MRKPSANSFLRKKQGLEKAKSYPKKKKKKSSDALHHEKTPQEIPHLVSVEELSCSKGVSFIAISRNRLSTKAPRIVM